MDSSLIGEALLVLAMILANGLFALAEMAMVSARPARLRQLAEEGAWGASRALAMNADPNIFLSVVQIGITLVGILAGAYGGATLAEPLAHWLSQWPSLAPYAPTGSLVAVVVAITYLSLIVGELVPKRVAMQFSENLACIAAPPMHALSVLFKPLVWALDFSGDMMLRPFGLHEGVRRPVTPEELCQMAQQGHAEGGIDRAEMEMVARVFQLSDRPVAAAMTPRNQVEWLSLESSRDELKTQLLLSHYSRFPVAGESLDQPLGVVNARDLLSQLLAGGPVDLRAMLKPPLFVPDSLSVMDAMARLRGSDCAMALVIDQYGACSGLLTLEDMVGIMADAALLPGSPGAALQATPEGGFVAPGLSDIQEVRQQLGWKKLPGEEKAVYHTLGGMAMEVLQRVPKEGDTFTWEGWTLAVGRMDGPRVAEIRLQPPSA